MLAGQKNGKEEVEGRDLQHEKGVIADLLSGWIRNCLKLGELGSRGKEEQDRVSVHTSLDLTQVGRREMTKQQNKLAEQFLGRTWLSSSQMEIAFVASVTTMLLS